MAARDSRPRPDKNDLRRSYEAGTSIRALAESSGFCYGTVRRWLLDAGTELRKPGGNRRRPPTITAA